MLTRCIFCCVFIVSWWK